MAKILDQYGRKIDTDKKEIKATFDLASHSNENANHWANADNLSARAAVSPGVRRLVRTRSRYEAENNGWYSGILRTAVNHIIQLGPRLQIQAGERENADRVERQFAAWSRSVDFVEKLRIVFEAYWRDGEVFIHRKRNKTIEPWTLDFEVIESDQVTSPWSELQSSPYVDDGIMLDPITGAKSYHILDHHPGSNDTLATDAGKWYPASEVLHLYRRERPGQTRGIPRATPSLQMLPIMRRQELATLATAEQVANFAMYLKTNSPNVDPEDSPADFAEIEMARNMLTTLPKGWEIGQVQPNQPGPSYTPFQQQALQSFSRCTNMPFSLAAGSGKDSNFSSFKGDMKNVWEPEVVCEQSRTEIKVVEPIFQWFLEDSVYVPGSLDGMPSIQEIDHKFTWPGLPELDPIVSANAATIRVSTGQSTIVEENAKLNKDWETEAERGASAFGIPVEQYKQAIFTRIFAVPGIAPVEETEEQESQEQNAGV